MDSKLQGLTFLVPLKSFFLILLENKYISKTWGHGGHGTGHSIVFTNLYRAQFVTNNIYIFHSYNQKKVLELKL